ncbi:MAG TPA: M14 family zinc carboxypeptidase, partial [Solirubrobacterales bacterium]|nr:M14 family zinc carboxypeptidase [Solirubrobacterales bacterium]
GLSADGRRLVLSAFRYAYPRPHRWTTRLAILSTGPHPRQRPGTGSTPLERAPAARFVLRGDLRPLALSPDGARLYLAENVKPGYPGNYVIREMNASSGRLLPGVLFDSRWSHSGIEATPITALADGGRLFALYYGKRKTVYLQVLDTARRAVFTKPLPQLTGLPNPMMLKLRLDADRGRLVVRGRPPELRRRAALLAIATHGFAVRARRVLRAAVAHARFLAFAKTPRHRSGGIGLWVGAVGRSAGGRPIVLKELGDRRHRGRVLVFGCVHGDECAARHLQPLGNAGCPDPETNIYLVPDLDPDGSAAGTRLNADGVDITRNFSVDWRPIGRRGDPEYSGPQPFSEPETRLAARIVRHLRPRVTIWFHQHNGPVPFVRAWGQSAPAGRLFARLAGIRFEPLPWLDGTAPNWQNRRFPGAASYVVELPPGPLAPDLRRRLERAIDRIGRREARVGED